MWDAVLRKFALGDWKFAGIESWRWVSVLKPYFESHTPLAAALIAGFVGAVAYALIESFAHRVGGGLLGYAMWVLFVSAAVGIPMRLSGLFPRLEVHYYKPLGFAYSTCTDAFSGAVVCATMLGAAELARQVAA